MFGTTKKTHQTKLHLTDEQILPRVYELIGTLDGSSINTLTTEQIEEITDVAKAAVQFGFYIPVIAIKYEDIISAIELVIANPTKNTKSLEYLMSFLRAFPSLIIGQHFLKIESSLQFLQIAVAELKTIPLDTKTQADRSDKKPNTLQTTINHLRASLEKVEQFQEILFVEIALLERYLADTALLTSLRRNIFGEILEQIQRYNQSIIQREETDAKKCIDKIAELLHQLHQGLQTCLEEHIKRLQQSTEPSDFEEKHTPTEEINVAEDFYTQSAKLCDTEATHTITALLDQFTQPENSANIETCFDILFKLILVIERNAGLYYQYSEDMTSVELVCNFRNAKSAITGMINATIQSLDPTAIAHYSRHIKYNLLHIIVGVASIYNTDQVGEFVSEVLRELARMINTRQSEDKSSSPSRRKNSILFFDDKSPFIIDSYNTISREIKVIYLAFSEKVKNTFQTITPYGQQLTITGKLIDATEPTEFINELLLLIKERDKDGKRTPRTPERNKHKKLIPDKPLPVMEAVRRYKMELAHYAVLHIRREPTAHVRKNKVAPENTCILNAAQLAQLAQFFESDAFLHASEDLGEHLPTDDSSATPQYLAELRQTLFNFKALVTYHQQIHKKKAETPIANDFSTLPGISRGISTQDMATAFSSVRTEATTPASKYKLATLHQIKALVETVEHDHGWSARFFCTTISHGTAKSVGQLRKLLRTFSDQARSNLSDEQIANHYDEVERIMKQAANRNTPKTQPAFFGGFRQETTQNLQDIINDKLFECKRRLDQLISTSVTEESGSIIRHPLSPEEGSGDLQNSLLSYGSGDMRTSF